MATLLINGEEHEALFSVWTLTVYEQEFKSDMIKDVLGKITPHDDSEMVFISDWNMFSWPDISRAAWAAIKAADDSTPSYIEWVKGIDSIDLGSVIDVVIPEMIEKFFPSRATVSE